MVNAGNGNQLRDTTKQNGTEPNFHLTIVEINVGMRCLFFNGDIHNVRPPFDSVQLVSITPVSMVYGTYNYS